MVETAQQTPEEVAAVLVEPEAPELGAMAELVWLFLDIMLFINFLQQLQEHLLLPLTTDSEFTHGPATVQLLFRGTKQNGTFC
jgi:hypothetical protein